MGGSNGADDGGGGACGNDGGGGRGWDTAALLFEEHLYSLRRRLTATLLAMRPSAPVRTRDRECPCAAASSASSA